MPARAGKRKPGPPAKPRSRREAALFEHESQTRSLRRRVSGKDRRFVQILADQDFRDPNTAANLAGFREPYIGERLVSRLHHLIEAERVRIAMVDQMELDEALRLTAQMARACVDDKVKLQALRTVLQVHGVLSDKPMPPTDRRSVARQVAELVESLKASVASKPGGRVRVRAMLAKTPTTAAIALSASSDDPMDAPLNDQQGDVVDSPRLPPSLPSAD